MNFLEFIENKKQNESDKKILTEAFKDSQLGKAKELILKVLKKETGEVVISLGNFETKIGGKEFTSELFVTPKAKQPVCFTFNWLNSGQSTQIYSVSFFKDMDTFINKRGKSELTISTFGCSIVYLLPIIGYIINTKDFDMNKNDATKFIKAIFTDNIKEAKKYPLYIGALKYTIMEGLSNDLVEKTFKYNLKNNIFESDFEDMLRWKKDKLKELQDAIAHKNDSFEANQRQKDLWKEYEEIKKAIKGGAGSIEEVQLAIQKSQTVEVHSFEGEDKIEAEVNKIKKNPDQVFKEMEKYINMVIKGITPSVILCGAPGVGKSYRVKQLLKKHNYHEEQNLCTIKGKCTPRVLYMKLLDFKNKGDIVLIDDADGLVGPKAPEDVINILKAALDSTGDDEGRLVSYGVSGPLKDDEGLDIPKKFYYNGGCIVITNYNAGQLDTALRGRSFIQDIHFSTDEVLQIIEKLLPTLDPEHLSKEAKEKAFEYLKELAQSKSKMEISIRTFGICSKIFEACGEDVDFTDDDARSMIKEQMKLQADRGGKKY